MPRSAQLAADRSDERDRKLGSAADPPRRHRLEPGEDREHAPHAGLALDESDGGSDLGDDLLLRQRHAG